MQALRIHGGRPLRGPVAISGAKNAALPIMAAALLAEGKSVLQKTPELGDVETLSAVLRHMGVGVTHAADGDLSIDASHIDHSEATYDLVRTMRASILVLGPLLARCKSAKVSLPGGCAIGARPIDQHLKGLRALGATIALEHGYVIATAPNGLRGAHFRFDIPSPTGTENVLLASVLAQGTTVLDNVAPEPEVADLVDALIGMGARIEGRGTQQLTIVGQPSLKPFCHRVMSDRIEFGTLLIAGALAGDGLSLTGGVAQHCERLIDILRATGATVDVDADGTVHTQKVACPRSHDVTTAAYPGMATDLQAQLMAYVALAKGTSVITETIFENRFMHVAELNRLGADIRVDGRHAIVHGQKSLSGATVMATDLRASASLVLAGLVAEGETILRRVYHLDRGYQHLERKLSAVGAAIERFVEA